VIRLARPDDDDFIEVLVCDHDDRIGL